MSTSIRTASGKTSRVPDHVDLRKIVGLDSEGRIVVDDYRAFATPPAAPDSLTRPFLFALSACCAAYDKGGESGVYCRSCYGDEAGDYLFFRNADGSWLGLDPMVEIRTSAPMTDELDGLAAERGVEVKRFPTTVSLRCSERIGDDTVALLAVLHGSLAETADV